MFGWLFPASCPADPAAKQWLEQRLLWLTKEFGVSRFAHHRMILPTPEFFPDPYDETKASAQILLKRVCRYMGVKETSVRLTFYSEAQRPLFVDANGYATAPSAGLYKPGDVHSIHLEMGQLHDPMSLVGTMAHELGHARLLGEGRVDPRVFDHELLTDFMTVFQGMGIFLANVPRHWDSGFTEWPGTKLKKPEYMTTPMFAYALGLWGWLRDEASPAWLPHLHYNVRGECKQALRFLFKTQDTSLKSLKVQMSEWIAESVN